MTRKDYDRAAKMLLAEYETAQGDYAGEVSTAIEMFVRFFKEDNPRFDEKKFREACTMRPSITHVAIRFEGKVYSLPSPNRHHDVIRHIAEVTGATFIDSLGDDQGFLDASGRYLTRKQALVSAVLNEQVKDKCLSVKLGELYSEDVW